MNHKGHRGKSGDWKNGTLARGSRECQGHHSPAPVGAKDSSPPWKRSPPRRVSWEGWVNNKNDPQPQRSGTSLLPQACAQRSGAD